ncbi:hypothetical protein EV668_1563 [Enterovirga rhinocerotis]|uniref:Uncharacterized protein n=1 Tax=Enterovirga rhinocerotis TaxID=1339210 RepID=A0A4R7C6Q6_9HYPH|nr:hypothetical protein EV668_1563 [Enterovirga rhinocerotis]
MTKWQPLFFSMLFAIAIAFVLNSLPPWVCPVPDALLPPNPTSPSDKPSSPLQPVCLEFWFNRYQTSVGGLFTLAAAAVAFYAV